MSNLSYRQLVEIKNLRKQIHEVLDMLKQKELITVRIWPDNLDWMSAYLMKGERSDFIRNAINDAIDNIEQERQADAAANPTGKLATRRTFVKRYLENPL